MSKHPIKTQISILNG